MLFKLPAINYINYYNKYIVIENNYQFNGIQIDI